jgi:hypothetical protein
MIKVQWFRLALLRMEEQFELQELQQSADLYAEIYEQDAELQEVTKSAISLNVP